MSTDDMKSIAAQNAQHGTVKGGVPAPSSWVEIDQGVLRTNTHAIRKALGPGAGVIAVVKADGYGHGLVAASQQFIEAGAKCIGVGTAQDAIALRRADISSRILVIYPVLEADLHHLILNAVDITVTSLELVIEAETIAKKAGKKARLHVQVETGMHHYGASFELSIELAQRIAQSKHLVLAGMSTHYVAASNDAKFTQEQHQRFLAVLKQLTDLNTTPEMVHSANSAAVDRLPESWDTVAYRRVTGADVCVRIGCLLYGTYQPRNRELATNYAFRSLTARIAEIKKVLRGETVGYFNDFISDRDRTIAVLPVGWGSNGFFPVGGHALIGSTKVPILGPIGANACAVDISDLRVEIGDEAVLLGESGGEKITLDELALQHGTFINRVIAMMGASSHRIYIEG